MVNVSFRGLVRTEPLADQQVRNDCWLEAIENIVQLYYPGTPNNFSDYLRKQMIEDGYDGYVPAVDNVVDPTVNYPEILRACGIDTEWYSFDNDFNRAVLQQNRVIFLIGNVQWLSCYRGNAGFHAIVLTDSQVDANNCLWYYGLDSNFRSETCVWPWNEIQDYAAAYINVAKKPAVLVTTQAMRWPYRNS